MQIQDAEEELSATATLEHGAISISATETALNIYLSEKLRAFHTEYPGIRLRISNHSTPQAVQAVTQRRGGFRHRVHPRRGGKRAENGGADALL